MDRLDIRLLRELVQGGTIWPANPKLTSSHRTLARKLGVSAGTVRNRVLRMTRAGFLQGIRVYVNPSALGLVSGSYTLQTPQGPRRHQVIERLSEVAGVVFFENFHGPLLGLGLVAVDDAGMQHLLSEIDQVAGCPRGTYTLVHHPPCGVRMNEAEWELIAHLVPDGFGSYRALSEDLRVPIRTLKRRVAKLVAGGALMTFPRMNYRALDHGLMAELLVAYAPGPSKDASRSAVIRELDPWMTYAGVWVEFEIYRLILPNLSMVTHLAESIAEMPGLLMSQMELVDGVSDRFEALLPYIARHRASLPGPDRPSSRHRQRALVPQVRHPVRSLTFRKDRT
ncbi:MAG: Lrp/AsnC family transcriptional regulator [Euryarchaeota archaeon]|nr:Lrp/AsnC family transcriptional regulator [Euryarchaeota archaeon]MDE1879811.1 Lrp/AsnC family transcriptional regulator [Euryarchaeota archaeon]